MKSHLRKYDVMGIMTRLVDREGKVTEYAYDKLGCMTREPVYGNGIDAYNAIEGE